MNDCFLCNWVCGDVPKDKCDAYTPMATLYYSVNGSLFNIGWAAVQISTMAIVVGLTQSQTRRDKLISQRNGFTFVANLSVLGFALIMINSIEDPFNQFTYMAYVLTGVGLLICIFYLFTVPEVKLCDEAAHYNKLYLKNKKDEEDAEGQQEHLLDGANASGEELERTGSSAESEVEVHQWSDWLKDGNFYVHGMVYMFVRLAVNVTMSIQPFYLVYVLQFEGEAPKPHLGEARGTPIAIALVPLASYTTSMIFSIFFYKSILRCFGNRLYPLFIGVIIIGVGSTPLVFLPASAKYAVYACTPIQGVGLAIMLNTATSLISDVIGDDETSSAFVYGCYSLLDKFSGGLVLTIITSYLLENEFWLRMLTGVLPTVMAILSLFFTWLGQYLYKDKLRQLSMGSALNKNTD